MIRRATPADADALSALARECFTQTFEHLYAPGGPREPQEQPENEYQPLLWL